MKAVIFGANGQDGHYLDELLQLRGIETVRVSRSGPGTRADVSGRAEVDALIANARPEYVFHLAARSTARYEAMFENHETISTGTLNILDAVRTHCPGARVFIAGSGLQFENHGTPIDETAPFAPTSPYAVARIQSVFAARYFRSLGLRTYVGYFFHHESPLRKPGHVSRMIALAAQRIAAGAPERFSVGDISVVKEWTFAGDAMRAVLALVDQDETTEAIIGSGEAHSIEEWLERCFGLIGCSWRDHVDLEPWFRPEYPRLVSNPRLIKSLGWKPTVSFERLAELMVQSPQ